MIARRNVIVTILALPVLMLTGSRYVTASEADAWAALRSGAVVLFRHANAPGTGDPSGFRLGSCSTQRNLDEEGRRQAVRIGERFRSENVRVGAVLSSEWCRAFDTAELAFPGMVQREPAFNSFFEERSQEPAQIARARALLQAWRGAGTLVVVTHQVNITALSGIAPSEGEGIVLGVTSGALSVIGRIRP